MPMGGTATMQTERNTKTVPIMDLILKLILRDSDEIMQKALLFICGSRQTVERGTTNGHLMSELRFCLVMVRRHLPHPETMLNSKAMVLTRNHRLILQMATNKIFKNLGWSLSHCLGVAKSSSPLQHNKACSIR